MELLINCSDLNLRFVIVLWTTGYDATYWKYWLLCCDHIASSLAFWPLIDQDPQHQRTSRKIDVWRYLLQHVLRPDRNQTFMLQQPADPTRRFVRCDVRGRLAVWYVQKCMMTSITSSVTSNGYRSPRWKCHDFKLKHSLFLATMCPRSLALFAWISGNMPIGDHSTEKHMYCLNLNHLLLRHCTLCLFWLILSMFLQLRLSVVFFVALLLCLKMN